MKTYEGVMTIKWYENDSGGDRRPLTIDTESKDTLKIKLSCIKNDFLTKGEYTPRFEKHKLPYSVAFDMSERK